MEQMLSYSKAQLKDLKIKQDEINRAKEIEDTVRGAYRFVIEKAKAGETSIIYPPRLNPKLSEAVVKELKKLFPDSTIALKWFGGPPGYDIHICWI